MHTKVAAMQAAIVTLLMTGAVCAGQANLIETRTVSGIQAVIINECRVTVTLIAGAWRRSDVRL